MTRILFLIKSLGRGGAERLLVDTATRLDRTKFSITVAYTHDSQAELAPEFLEAQIPIVCLGGSRNRHRWLYQLHRYLRTHHYDILHVHSPYIASALRLLPRPADTHLFYTEHNEWDTYHRATRWANALTYSRNDHVFAVSERVRQNIRPPRPLQPFAPRVDTLHHGVDIDALRTRARHEPLARSTLGVASTAPVVGTIANFRPEKGHHVLLEAAQQVRASVPDVRFVFVGGGPLENAVRAQAAALELEDVVLFAGYRPDAIGIATTFDVFALPSYHEGLPISLIEAMALGKAVVVTDAGGMPEVVQDGQQGLVVPVGDPSAIAHALIEVLTNPRIRAEMGAEAAVRAQAFDIRRAVKQLEEAYNARARA